MFEDEDAIYMAELEFGHEFVQNNYERIMNSDYEDIRELYEELQAKKEM